MIKYSFSFCTLTLATFLSVSPAAMASTALPDIPPEQIALDIERRLDNRTGVVEFHAPTFDPFESVDQLVGRVSLKSNTRVTGIDGHIARGGAIIDINFLYTTDSDDLYDVAGFESAVFFTGEDVNATYYDNRIIECSESIRDVVYQNDYYHGASYGLIGGLYRPYPVYRGHSFFGFRGLNYGWQYPIGFSSRSRFNSSRRFNTRSRFGRSGRFNDSRRVSNDRRGLRSGSNSRRDFDDRRDRRSQSDGDGSRGAASRGNRSQVRTDRGENRRIDRGEKSRLNRSGLRTIKGRAPASSQARVSEARPSTATRSISASAASETVRSSTRSPSSSAAPTRSRSTRSNSQAIKNSGSQASRPQRSSSSSNSQPKQSSSRSQPKQSSSRSSSRSQSKQSNRSSNRSSSRSSNRSSRSSKSSSRRKLNFFPQGFLQFGTSGYSTRTVSVSHKCARDENLSLHIPRERLEAARYEGLTVFVIDRLGQDVPVYIPPNYIEGFVTTAFGNPQSYQQPQGASQSTYQAPTYQQPRVTVPQSPSSQPRVYGDPNGVTSSGGYPQNEGF
ncbi:MAG: hypothetical protein ABJ275_01965 [Maricaulaceae bacterium]